MEYERKRSRVNWMKWLLFVLIGGGVALAAVVVVNFSVKNLNRETYEEMELYQYFAGERYDYGAGVMVDFNGEITELKYLDKNVELDSTPIFVKDERKMILPAMMEIVTYNNNGEYFRTGNKMSMISVRDEAEEEHIWIKTGGKEQHLEEGFLYDGEDLYVFPYGAVIMIDGTEYALGRLSYVKIGDGAQVDMYDSQADKYTTVGEFSEITMKKDYCTLDMVSDFLTCGIKSKILVKDFSEFRIYQF